MEAYRVPFRVDRSRAPRYRLVNVSAETLRWVRVEMDGPGLALAPLTPRLEPGATLAVDVRGDDLALATTMIIRWLRPNHEEYLWRIAF